VNNKAPQEDAQRAIDLIKRSWMKDDLDDELFVFGNYGEITKSPKLIEAVNIVEFISIMIPNIEDGSRVVYGNANKLFMNKKTFSYFVAMKD